MNFEYHLIRKAGEPIKTFGGIASGPEPFKAGIESIRALLDSFDDKLLTSVAIVDVMNYIGKFVVSGNVRRSSEIAIGQEDDLDFIQMKNPKLYKKELIDRRWASNNAIFVTPKSSFCHAVQSITENGEPGFIFLDNARHYGRMKDGWNPENSSKFDACIGFNPCAEQGLKHAELCNLVETFPANHDSAEEYHETLKFAFMYAKTVTLLPTHSALTNQVMLSNRRIGLSMSGIQQALKKFGFANFFESFCDEGYDVVRHWDRIYSRWFGIPTSIKVTTVKPSGTVSLLAGATPGVHCTHSKYYLQTFRVAAFHPLVKKLVSAGYTLEFSATDKAIYQSAGGDLKKWRDTLQIQEVPTRVLTKFGQLGGSLVVYFPVQEKNFTKSKFDISLWEQLLLARELQDKWSDNSVSITVTFKPEEARDLKSAIEYLAPYVKTLSFLPLVDHDYVQAPYQECSETEYNETVKKLKKLRLVSLRGGQAKGEKYCTNDGCAI
jgi:adenosylcobalamin-dependent ribonucleoside-triphosphate reductase